MRLQGIAQAKTSRPVSAGISPCWNYPAVFRTVSVPALRLVT